MQKLYKIIKRKNNRRRIGAVWVFLLLIELVCPVFGHEAAEDVELESSRAVIVYSTESTAKSSNDLPSMTACDEQHGNKIFCLDECLCHSTAIPSANSINIKESVSAVARIPHHYENTVFNFLPPPFQPPKNS